MTKGAGWLLVLSLSVMYGCANSIDSDASRSEFSIVRIYDPTTGIVSEPVNKAYLYHPEWVPDGTKIVTDTVGASSQTRYLSDIRLLTVASGEIENLTQTPDTDEHSPMVSPDGSKIVYVADNQLVIMTLSDQSTNTLNVSGFSPTWRSDSAAIVYEAEGVFVHTLTQATPIAPGKAPVWLTDTKLLYTRQVSGTDSIYLYDIQTETESFVTTGNEIQASSDGTFMVYTYKGDIYKRVVAEDTESLLVENAEMPQVSHDMATLAFVKNGTVYIAPMTNLGNRTAIGAGTRPRWSVTGQILFQSLVYR